MEEKKKAKPPQPEYARAYRYAIFCGSYVYSKDIIPDVHVHSGTGSAASIFWGLWLLGDILSPRIDEMYKREEEDQTHCGWESYFNGSQRMRLVPWSILVEVIVPGCCWGGKGECNEGSFLRSMPCDTNRAGGEFCRRDYRWLFWCRTPS